MLYQLQILNDHNWVDRNTFVLLNGQLVDYDTSKIYQYNVKNGNIILPTLTKVHRLVPIDDSDLGVSIYDIIDVIGERITPNTNKNLSMALDSYVPQAFGGKRDIEDIVDYVKQSKFKLNNVKKFLRLYPDRIDEILIAMVGLNDYNAVKYLLDHGANPNNYSSESIINAAEIGNLDIMELLYDNGGNININYDEPFQIASQRGYLDMVEFLYDLGADVNANDDYAIRWAASEGYIDIVDFLLDKGVDVNSNGGAPIVWAVNDNKFDMVKFLVDNGALINSWNNAPLRKAAEKGFTRILKYLIENGGDPNLDNNLLFILAVVHGQLETIKYLLQFVPNVNSVLKGITNIPPEIYNFLQNS